MQQLIKEMQYRNRPVQDPILALARICVNEEGWSNKTGCAAIWQVVQNVRLKHCNTTRFPQITQCVNGEETYLSAMRRLSKRVTGMVPATKRHHMWTSTLQMNDNPPQLWLECKRAWKNKKVVTIPHGCHGTWDLYVDKWRDIRKFAYNLYTGRAKLNPCPTANDQHGRVLAWGYEGDLWLAKKRNLVQIDCGDTNNMFFAKPKIKSSEQLALRLPAPLPNNVPNKPDSQPQPRYGR
jgi:hypothetical protein